MEVDAESDSSLTFDKSVLEVFDDNPGASGIPQMNCPPSTRPFQRRLNRRSPSHYCSQPQQLTSIISHVASKAPASTSKSNQAIVIQPTGQSPSLQDTGVNETYIVDSFRSRGTRPNVADITSHFEELAVQESTQSPATPSQPPAKRQRLREMQQTTPKLICLSQPPKIIRHFSQTTPVVVVVEPEERNFMESEPVQSATDVPPKNTKNDQPSSSHRSFRRAHPRGDTVTENITGREPPLQPPPKTRKPVQKVHSLHRSQCAFPSSTDPQHDLDNMLVIANTASAESNYVAPPPQRRRIVRKRDRNVQPKVSRILRQSQTAPSFNRYIPSISKSNEAAVIQRTGQSPSLQDTGVNETYIVDSFRSQGTRPNVADITSHFEELAVQESTQSPATPSQPPAKRQRLREMQKTTPELICSSQPPKIIRHFSQTTPVVVVVEPEERNFMESEPVQSATDVPPKNTKNDPPTSSHRSFRRAPPRGDTVTENITDEEPPRPCKPVQKVHSLHQTQRAFPSFTDPQPDLDNMLVIANTVPAESNSIVHPSQRRRIVRKRDRKVQQKAPIILCPSRPASSPADTISQESDSMEPPPQSSQTIHKRVPRIRTPHPISQSQRSFSSSTDDAHPDHDNMLVVANTVPAESNSIVPPPQRRRIVLKRGQNVQAKFSHIPRQSQTAPPRGDMVTEKVTNKEPPRQSPPKTRKPVQKVHFLHRSQHAFPSSTDPQPDLENMLVIANTVPAESNYVAPPPQRRRIVRKRGRNVQPKVSRILRQSRPASSPADTISQKSDSMEPPPQSSQTMHKRVPRIRTPHPISQSRRSLSSSTDDAHPDHDNMLVVATTAPAESNSIVPPPQRRPIVRKRGPKVQQRVSRILRPSQTAYSPADTVAEKVTETPRQPPPKPHERAQKVQQRNLPLHQSQRPPSATDPHPDHDNMLVIANTVPAESDSMVSPHQLARIIRKPVQRTRQRTPYYPFQQRQRAKPASPQLPPTIRKRVNAFILWSREYRQNANSKVTQKILYREWKKVQNKDYWKERANEENDR